MGRGKTGNDFEKQVKDIRTWNLIEIVFVLKWKTEMIQVVVGALGVMPQQTLKKIFKK